MPGTRETVPSHTPLQVLQRSFCEQRAWVPVTTPTAHLLCDARSTPPRVAAVAIVDCRTYWSDWAPDPEVMGLFQSRRDGQIMSLELLSIAFGMFALSVVPLRAAMLLCAGMDTFAELLRGRNVHVHSDNTGAQYTTSKGVARTFDHTCLVHGIW